MRKSAALLVVLALEVPASVAHAATYYVATTGSDANPGTSTAPFKTIHHGVTVLKAGDTLIVRNGTYTNDMTDSRGIMVTASGTASAPITIRAETRWGVRVVWTDSTANHYGFFLTGSHLVLDGFDVTNASTGAFWVYDDATNNTIEHNLIRDCAGSGIFTQQRATATRILKNFIHHNGKEASLHHGIYTTGDDTLIADNVIVWNAGAGIQVAGYSIATNVRISNNVVAWNGSPGIWLYQAMDRIYIQNNILHKNATYAVASYAATGSGVFIDRNILYGNIRGTFNTTDGGSTVAYTIGKNYTGNPLFVNDSASDPTTGGFQVQSNSPAINSGLTLSEVLHDVIDIVRPQGSAYDIGAYEVRVSQDAPAAPTDLRIVH